MGRKGCSVVGKRIRSKSSADTYVNVTYCCSNESGQNPRLLGKLIDLEKESFLKMSCLFYFYYEYVSCYLQQTMGGCGSQ